MPVSIPDTFLTESRTNDVLEPETMTRVRKEHSRLQEVVFSLNQKISQVLEKQEGDFLAAYRAHMFNVQKELQTLRQRVIEAENALQKNDKMRKLEDECDWYRKEALRLDSFNMAMKEDLKYMKGKMEILEDDRNWMLRQLKACKKQNKALREGNSPSAELKMGEKPDQGLQQADPDVVCGEHTLRLESSQSQPLLSGIMGTLYRARKTPHAESAPGLAPFRTEISVKNTQGPARRGHVELVHLQREDVLRRKVRVLERKLIKEHKETVRAKALRSRDAIERAEMEDFFTQCIEDVKKNIESRKVQSRARALHARSTGSRHVLDLPGNMSGRSPEAPLHEMEYLPPKVTLEDFTAADRRAVVESFLEREDVVGHLFDLIFPVVSSSKGVRPLECNAGL